MSDATLIKGAQELAAAKGTGGAGIKAISKTVKAVGDTVSKAMAPDKNGKIGADGKPKNSDADLRRLAKKLKTNDFKAVELDGFTLEGRDKVEAELLRMNKTLDEAETKLYESDINSEEYEKAYKQKTRVMSEYKAFVKAGKTLRDFRANERNIISIADNQDGIRGGYSRVSLNSPNIQKTTMLVGDEWSWNSEEMDFEWNFKDKEKLRLSNMSDYKPMLFDQVADFRVYLQEQKVEATKQINPKKRVAMHQALIGELRTALLENKFGPHILEALIGNAELPEVNSMFEELDINFANNELTPQERIKSFKDNGEAAINILADAVFPEMNPKLPPKEEQKTLDDYEKSIKTSAYAKYKDISADNPSPTPSQKLNVGTNIFLQWIPTTDITDENGDTKTVKVNKWMLVNIKGEVVAPGAEDTFDTLDEALGVFPFSKKVK